jgi:hypothetical protein
MHTLARPVVPLIVADGPAASSENIDGVNGDRRSHSEYSEGAGNITSAVVSSSSSSSSSSGQTQEMVQAQTYIPDHHVVPIVVPTLGNPPQSTSGAEAVDGGGGGGPNPIRMDMRAFAQRHLDRELLADDQFNMREFETMIEQHLWRQRLEEDDDAALAAARNDRNHDIYLPFHWVCTCTWNWRLILCYTFGTFVLVRLWIIIVGTGSDALQVTCAAVMFLVLVAISRIPRRRARIRREEACRGSGAILAAVSSSASFGPKPTAARGLAAS